MRSSRRSIPAIDKKRICGWRQYLRSYESRDARRLSATRGSFARRKGGASHSHVFIACCRARGIPTRYVSGYRFTSAEQRSASHAWVDDVVECRTKLARVDVTLNR